RNDAVAFGSGVNIIEDTAHPGIGTDVLIGYGWATKGLEDIHYNPTKLTHISREVLIDELNIRYGVGADILIGIVVVHHNEIAGHMPIDHQSSLQLWQNGLRQIGIQCCQITAKFALID